MLILVLFKYGPQWYLDSENTAFERIKKESELDCNTMPLHCFLKEESSEKLQEYVQTGGSLELKDNWGQSGLFWAISNRSEISLIHTLLESGANPNTKDENETTALFYVLELKQFNVADILIEYGADVDLLSGNINTGTTLHYCVLRNDLDCVEYLIANNARVNIKDKYGYTVLDRLEIHPHIDASIVEAIKN